MARLFLLTLALTVTVCQAQETTTAPAGGSSFADFDSLIELIQTTVAPDTWDALGGPSTMREYPQGVYVDPSGTLMPRESVASTNALANLASTLRQDSKGTENQPGYWLDSSTMRCVSLGRLHDHWAARKSLSMEPSESMMHLAGLSKVQYVLVSDHDIVLAGPVGGIESHQGWVRDRRTLMAAIRLDFLSTAIVAARSGTAFGCTIDPTTQGMQDAATAAAKIQSKQLPIGKAAGVLADAIGMQQIEIFGTPADTPIGLMMVEADRHMKQLALGIDPMPGHAINYLDAIDANIANGPPNDLLLRLWFTANPCQVQSDPDRKVFELNGTPIRLSGQNERAMADGERGHILDDPRTERFVENFNENWTDIRSTYPIYAGLQSIFEAAAVAAITDRQARSAWHSRLLDSFAAMSSEANLGLPVAKQVPTIAVLHRSRSGKRRHSILIASGGVAVRPSSTISTKLDVDPALRSYQSVPENRPKAIGRWWWDAN